MKIQSFTLRAFTALVVFGTIAGSARAEEQVRFQNASFEEKNRRYPSPHDMFHHISRIVPYLSHAYLPRECTVLTEANAAVLGSTIPSYGQALETEPGALFVQLYSKCLREAIRAGLSNTGNDVREQNLIAILGRELAVILVRTMAEVGVRQYSIADLPWADWTRFPAEIQAKVLSRLIYYLVGPARLLKRYGYVGPNNVFGANIQTELELASHLHSIISAKKSSLRILDVIESITVVLRLGPILMN